MNTLSTKNMIPRELSYKPADIFFACEISQRAITIKMKNNQTNILEYCEPLNSILDAGVVALLFFFILIVIHL